VVDAINGAGLGIFGPNFLALGTNRKGEFFNSSFY